MESDKAESERGPVDPLPAPAHKNVEQELKRTLAFVRGIIDAFPDFLFEGSAEGRYLNAWTKNPELLTASREHLLGHTLNEVLSPESAAIAKAAFREADEAGLSFGKMTATRPRPSCDARRRCAICPSSR